MLSVQSNTTYSNTTYVVVIRRYRIHNGTDIQNNSMEHSPSLRARRSPPSQEIPHILCNANVPYCIHKRPPPVVILIHRNPVHTSPSHFLKIHSNINLPSTSRSSKWSLSLRLYHQNPACTSPVSNTCHMPCPSNSSLNHTWSGSQNINLLIM